MLASILVTALMRSAVQTVPAATAAAPAAQRARTKITIGDEIIVAVVGFQDYTAKYTVVDDGYINVVPIGEVHVLDRTLDDVQKEMAKRMARFVKDPVVIVTFGEKANSEVFVVGVDGVGIIPFRENMDIRTLLAGAKPNGQPVDTFIVRVFRSNVKIAEFNLQDALEGVDGKYWAGPLQPMDVMTVLSTEDQRVYMSSDFAHPGEMFVNRGSTLSQALSKAGGYILPVTAGDSRISLFEDRAKVVVRRGGQQFVFKLHNDPAADAFTVQAGDFITVDTPRRILVTVNGSVKNARSVTLLSGDDVRAAVAAAGGTSDDGTLSGVLVWHNNEVHSYDIRATATNQTPAPIDDGDIIYVQRNVRAFRILGAAKQPGIYNLPDDQRVFATDALAKAGGIEENGTFRRMYIMRPDMSGTFKPIEFNLDEYLKDGKVTSNPEILPGDVIYVSKAKGGIDLAHLTTLLSGLLLIDNITHNK